MEHNIYSEIASIQSLDEIAKVAAVATARLTVVKDQQQQLLASPPAPDQTIALTDDHVRQIKNAVDVACTCGIHSLIIGNDSIRGIHVNQYACIIHNAANGLPFNSIATAEAPVLQQTLDTVADLQDRVSEVRISGNYNKVLLKLLRLYRQLPFQVGSKGVLKTNINGLDVFVLPLEPGYRGDTRSEYESSGARGLAIVDRYELQTSRSNWGTSLAQRSVRLYRYYLPVCENERRAGASGRSCLPAAELAEVELEEFCVASSAASGMLGNVVTRAADLDRTLDEAQVIVT